MEVTTADFIPWAHEGDTMDLFKTKDNLVHATIKGITCNTKGPEFEDFINDSFFMQFGDFPPKPKLNQIIKKCNTFARLYVETKPVFRRFAKVDDAFYIDMGTADFAVIKITSKKVTIIYDPPAKFTRLKIQRSIAGVNLNAVAKNLNLLKKYIPFKTEEDFILFVSWLLSCMNADGGYPVLFLVGEQGSAKSSTCRLIKDLLDPSSVLLRNMPKTEQELMIAAINDFILCFDNTSKITDTQSDIVCKLATGSAFTKRRLYSNAAEVQLVSKNPCVINGISCLPTRQDLLDRSITVTLNFIAPENRKTEKELMASWEHDRPLILGALCQAASAALKNYDFVSERDLPRMADFAKWVIAAEENLPWEKGLFMETMRNLRVKIVEDALEADPVGMAVLRFMENRNEWKGTASELLDLLGEIAGQANNGYPGLPKIHNQLSQQLSRVSAFLREKGILFDRGHSGSRSITLTSIPLQADNQALKQAKKDAEKAATNKVIEDFKSVTQAQKTVEETEGKASENEPTADTNKASNKTTYF